MNYKFPLATAAWGQEEINATQRVIATGVFTKGTNVQECERDLARYVASKYCLMVNSGSSANLLMVGTLFCTKN